MEVRESITDSVDAELDRLISKRASQDRHPDPDEKEAHYMESVRRFNARRRGVNREAWVNFHRDQAARHRRNLAALVAHHEREAERLQTTEEWSV
jgi:hypothetical protein